MQKICSCFGTTIFIWWSWKFKFYVPEIIYLLLLSISDQHNLVIYKFQSVHQKNIKLIFLYSFDEHMQESWTMQMCLFAIQFLSLHVICIFWICVQILYIYIYIFLKFRTWVWLGFEPRLAKTSGILVQCPNHYTMGSDICLNYLTYICTV